MSSPPVDVNFFNHTQEKILSHATLVNPNPNGQLRLITFPIHGGYKAMVFSITYLPHQSHVLAQAKSDGGEVMAMLELLQQLQDTSTRLLEHTVAGHIFGLGGNMSSQLQFYGDGQQTPYPDTRRESKGQQQHRATTPDAGPAQDQAPRHRYENPPVVHPNTHEATRLHGSYYYPRAVRDPRNSAANAINPAAEVAPRATQGSRGKEPDRTATRQVGGDTNDERRQDRLGLEARLGAMLRSGSRSEQTSSDGQHGHGWDSHGASGAEESSWGSGK